MLADPPPPPGHAAWLKWANAAALVLSIVFVVLGVIATSNAEASTDPVTGAYDPPDEQLAMVGVGLLLSGIAFGFVRLALGVIWLYVAWSAIPAPYRFTKSRAVSPGQAVGMLFVPIYQLYWVFVANVGLCDAMDGALASLGSQRRSPKALAVIACILQVIPYVNLLIAPFAWAAFMFAFDGARGELLQRLHASPPGHPPQPPYAPSPSYGGYAPPGY